MITRIIAKIMSVIYYSTTFLYYRLIFKKIGNRSRISRPLKLMGTDNIEIGSRVSVGKFGWLASDRRFGNEMGNIKIGDNTYIGNFCHIYSTGSICIEENVLIADKVYIADNSHGYEDIDTPILFQKVKPLSQVTIGQNSWIGENACILGVKIGKHCIIGSNSVLNKDLPDYSIAVGSPARIVKRYNFETQAWEKTNDKGEFLN